ncbi:hypothetical protein TRFO_38311 [Tritrichomonas foetus]|uniref:GTP-binding protein Parf n=1 Tax=Tritrichomonas foetus TaxID=1144522 RepID=A0A1J4JD37_9EUKA|nr:hypothetical protein TRFO_38311 [Tritrichomonas foetus]|eukprot:OHS95587.1 hypothetical protein TRFO_38311 [Tritrichomonas foetus]
MGNEQAIPQQGDGGQVGFQAVVPSNPQSATATLNQSVTPTEVISPDHKMLIVIRGTRKTGKTTLVTRMRGFAFDPAYQITPAVEITEIPWKSPSKENVLVTVWDTVEKMTNTYDDSDDNTNRMDASSVDTLKKADGVVVMIDYHSGESVALAEEIIRTVPDDLPVAVFSNFMDLENSTPIIPMPLMQYMGRFFYIPGSLKSNMGLIELSKWLTAPLINAKMKFALTMHQTVQAEFQSQNNELCKSAGLFLDLLSARKHQPVVKTIREMKNGAASSQSHKYQKPYQRTRLRRGSNHNNDQQQQQQQQQTQVKQESERMAAYRERKRSEDAFWDDDVDVDTQTTVNRVIKPTVNPDREEQIKPNPLVKRRLKPSQARKQLQQQQQQRLSSTNSSNSSLSSLSSNSSNPVLKTSSNPSLNSLSTSSQNSQVKANDEPVKKKRKKVVRNGSSSQMSHQKTEPQQQHVVKRRKKKGGRPTVDTGAEVNQFQQDESHDGYDTF